MPAAAPRPPVSLEEHLDAARSAKIRTTYSFTFPETVPGDARKITLVELTAEEELQATKRCRGDQFRLAYELIKQSIVDVDGTAVSIVDGTVDALLEKMHPKARRLLVNAYSSINTPTEDEDSLFLKSALAKVE